MYQLDSSFNDLVTRLHLQVVGFTHPRPLQLRGPAATREPIPARPSWYGGLLHWSNRCWGPLCWTFYDFCMFVFYLMKKLTAKLRIIKLMAVIIMHLGAAVLECLTMTLTEVWFFFQKVWWGQRISCVKLSWSAMSEGPLLVEHQRKEEQTYAKPCITFQWNHQVWKKKIGTSCIFVST